jgi:hypothetical protein
VLEADTPAGPTAAEMQRLSADTSASVGDLEANAELKTGSSADRASLATSLATLSLAAPTVGVEGGISSPIGDVSVDLPGAGVDVSSPLSPMGDVSVDLPGGSGAVSPPGGSGAASPSGAQPAASSPTAGISGPGGLVRTGEAAPTALSGATEAGLSSLSAEALGMSDPFGLRGPAHPARAGPFASLPVDLSPSSDWPSATADGNRSLVAPVVGTHAPAGGAPGSASSSTSSGSVVGLLATFALALLLGARRLKRAESFRRPVLFVSPLERPG